MPEIAIEQSTFERLQRYGETTRGYNGYDSE